MQAKTQYNDLVGTVAADISDFMPGGNLDSLLPKNYDSNRYPVVGFDVWGSGEKISCALLCRDKESDNDNSLITIDVSYDSNQFFDFFKRFHLFLYYKGSEEYIIK